MSINNIRAPKQVCLVSVFTSAAAAAAAASCQDVNTNNSFAIN